MLTLSVACEAIKKGTMSVQDAAMGLDAASQMQASARKNDGVTYTPWDVACQVVAQADPKPSESWLDTSIGRGMFLWATLHHMQDSGASLVDIEDFLHHRLHAVELNEQAAIDARCLLGAWCEHVGIKPPMRLWLTHADSLCVCLPRVDVMVGNPPYVRIQHLRPACATRCASNSTAVLKETWICTTRFSSKHCATPDAARSSRPTRG